MVHRSLIIKSIIFGVAGLAFIWLPLVDRIASQEERAQKALAEGKIFDRNTGRAFAPETVSPEALEDIARGQDLWKRFETQWITGILASFGLLALVVLNHALQSHRHRKKGAD